MPRTPPLCCLLALAASLPAQIGGDGRDGPFAPSTDTTLDTASRPGGEFRFTTIRIPAGVTVRVIGPHGVVLRSQGAVDIRGTLDADGRPNEGSKGGAGGPGGFAGGDGGVGRASDGGGPGGGRGGVHWPFSLPGSGGPAGHAQPGVPHALRMSPGGPAYGAELPLDFRGGSGGGGGANNVSARTAGPGGGGGGGAVALLGDGAISVGGAITARGAIGSGLGSGGVVLVRSTASVSVTGSIDATGPRRQVVFLVDKAGDGFVRIDAHGAAPSVRGTVRPAPKVTELPHLWEAAPLHVGAIWRPSAAVIPGDRVALFASTGPARVALPPLGFLLLDPAAIALLGTAVAPRAGLDPMAELAVRVPNEPRWLGARLWVQGIDFASRTGRPRLSNRLISVIGR